MVLLTFVPQLCLTWKHAHTTWRIVGAHYKASQILALYITDATSRSFFYFGSTSYLSILNTEPEVSA